MAENPSLAPHGPVAPTSAVGDGNKNGGGGKSNGGAGTELPGRSLDERSQDATTPAADEPAAEVEAAPLPRLVYYQTTDETVAATLAAIENSRWKAKGATPPICAVVDRLVGMRQLQPTELQGGGHYKKLRVVCAAELHDDLLRQVRMWTRLGYGAGQVQEELDARYGSLLETVTAAVGQTPTTAADE